MKTLWRAFFALGLIIFTACGERCEDKEFQLEARFSKNDSLVKPNFKRIYGLGGKGDIVFNKEPYLLPLDLSKDSVVYIFETDTSKDTLAIKYTRELRERSNRSYCLTLNQEELLSYTTFNVTCFNFERKINFLSNIQCSSYEVLIQL